MNSRINHKNIVTKKNRLSNLFYVRQAVASATFFTLVYSYNKNMLKMKNKGFTLAELLIVVAIIAILVAISLPLFSSRIAKANL